MTKASISLQELRRKIYNKAKTNEQGRFWGLYCHVCKKKENFTYGLMWQGMEK